MAFQLAAILRVQGEKGRKEWSQIQGKLAEIAAAAGDDPRTAVQAVLKLAKDASPSQSFMRNLEERVTQAGPSLLKGLVHLIADELDMTPLCDSEPVHMVDEESHFCQANVDRIIKSSAELSAPNAQYTVVSIIGSRCSGKSYLVNCLFGTKFPEMNARLGWRKTATEPPARHSSLLIPVLLSRPRSQLRLRLRRAAMPSWNDGDETSSDERLTDNSSELPLNVPETLYDPDFCGIETTCPETCGHGDKLARLVAFEGVETGRRFLGCARSGSGICGSVYWQDLEWPPSLKHCLLRLWKLYDKECTDRLKESCESSEAYYKLNMEKKKVEQKNKELQIELGKALSDSQGKDEMIEQNKKLYLMKEMAEKERDAVKEEKKKLEYALGDLFNAAEKNKQKLKKIKLILEE